MDNDALGAHPIEGMVARGFVVRFVFFVDGEAVGEFGAVIGQHGVNGEREAVEEAVEKTRCGLGPAIGQDLEVDEAGGAVDRDIGVTAAAVERRQIFDVDVDEAGRGVGVEHGGRSLLLAAAGGDAVALQATVDGAARQRGVDTAPHCFDDVVERQRQAAAQLDDQAFFPFGHRRGQPVRAGGSIDDLPARLPTRHGAAVDAEFAGQGGVARPAFLDIGAGARRGGGIGVELEIHHRVLPRSVEGGVGASSGRSPRWVHSHLPRAAPPDLRQSWRRRAGPSCGLPGRAAPGLAAIAAAAT